MRILGKGGALLINVASFNNMKAKEFLMSNIKHFLLLILLVCSGNVFGQASVEIEGFNRWSGCDKPIENKCIVATIKDNNTFDIEYKDSYNGEITLRFSGYDFSSFSNQNISGAINYIRKGNNNESIIIQQNVTSHKRFRFTFIGSKFTVEEIETCDPSDITAPKFTECTQEIELEVEPEINCEEILGSSLLNQIETPIAEDNCSNSITFSKIVKFGEDELNPEELYKSGEYTIKWDATDESSNSTNTVNNGSCYQTLHLVVKEKEAPTPECKQEPQSIQIETNGTECNVTPESVFLKLTKPEVKDNCTASEDIEVNGVIWNSTSEIEETKNFEIGKCTTSVRWTFTDASQNTSFCDETIDLTVIDKSINPDIESLSDKEIEMNSNAEKCGVKISDLITNSNIFPSITDKCDPNEKLESILISLYKNEESIDLTQEILLESGEYKISWQFVDKNGNKSKEYFQVINLKINDVTPPTFSCTDSEYSLELDLPGCSISAKEILDSISIIGFKEDILKGYNLSDNCSSTIEVTEKLWDIDNDKEYSGDFTKNSTKAAIKWYFTDEAGNIDSCVQKLKLTLNDVIGPVWNRELSPINATIGIFDKESCKRKIGDIIAQNDTITLLDECDNNRLKGLIESVNIGDDKNIDTATYKLGPGTYSGSIVWYFKDAAGNQSNNYEQQLSITIYDKVAPNIECGEASIIEFIQTSPTDKVTGNDVLLKLKNKTTAKDYCGELKSLVPYCTYTEDEKIMLEGKEGLTQGVYRITWVAIDASGNESTCEQEITIKYIDNVAPEIDCKNISEIVRIDACEADQTSNLFDYITRPSAYDVYEDKNIDGIAYLDDKEITNETIFAAGKEYQITWKFTDASGNFASCQQTWDIKKNYGLAPQIDCKDFSEPLRVTIAIPNECNIIQAPIDTLIKILNTMAPQKATRCGEYVTATASYIGGNTLLNPNYEKETTHKIQWTFKGKNQELENNEVSCEQEVIVTIIPDIMIETPCSGIVKKNIKVNVSEGTEGVSGGQILELLRSQNGGATPKATTSCGQEIEGVAYLNDQLLNNDVKLFNSGEYAIEWRFTEPNFKEKVTSCGQTILLDITTDQFYIATKYPITMCMAEENVLTAAGKFTLTGARIGFEWYKSTDQINWEKLDGDQQSITVNVNLSTTIYYKVIYKGMSATLEYTAKDCADEDSISCGELDTKLLFYETFGYFMAEDVYVDANGNIHNGKVRVNHHSYIKSKADNSITHYHPGDYIIPEKRGDFDNYFCQPNGEWDCNATREEKWELNVDITKYNDIIIKNFVAPDPTGNIVTPSSFFNLDGDANEFVGLDGHLFQSENPRLTDFSGWGGATRLQDGYYAIVKNPHDCEKESGTDYISCSDFTGNENGAMLMVNCGTYHVNNEIKSAAIYAQKVTLSCAAQNFNFSMAFRGASRYEYQNPGNIAVFLLHEFTDADKIKEDAYERKITTDKGEIKNLIGDSIETDSIYMNENVWRHIDRTYKLDEGIQEFWVVIYNNGLAGDGNDILIDDIMFSACTPKVNMAAKIGGKEITGNLEMCETEGFETLGGIVLKGIPEAGEITDYYYIFQYYDKATNKWINFKEYTESNSKGIDSVIIDVNNSAFYGEVQYRLIMADNFEDAIGIANGTEIQGCLYDIAENKMLITLNFGGNVSGNDTVFCGKEGETITIRANREKAIKDSKWHSSWFYGKEKKSIVENQLVVGSSDSIKLIVNNGAFDIYYGNTLIESGVSFTAIDSIHVTAIDQGAGTGTDFAKNCEYNTTIALSQVKGKPNAPCDKIGIETIYLTTADKCETTIESVLSKDYYASDICDDKFKIKGELYQEIDNEGTKTYEKVDKNITLPIGVHNSFYWVFTGLSGDTAMCLQPIEVVDKAAPSIDCNTFYPDFNATITLTNACETTLDILSKEIHDKCDNAPILGIPYLEVTNNNGDIDSIQIENGVTKVGIGEHKIIWIFEDQSGNKSYCEKTLTVKSDIRLSVIEEFAICAGDEFEKEVVLDSTVGVRVIVEGLPEGIRYSQGKLSGSSKLSGSYPINFKNDLECGTIETLQLRIKDIATLDIINELTICARETIDEKVVLDSTIGSPIIVAGLPDGIYYENGSLKGSTETSGEFDIVFKTQLEDCGTEKTLKLIINQRPKVTINNSDKDICPNSEYSLEFSITNGPNDEPSTEYTYHWSGDLTPSSTKDGEATFVIPNVCNKSYNISLYVTDSKECSSPTESITLLVDDKEKPTIILSQDSKSDKHNFVCEQPSEPVFYAIDNCLKENIKITPVSSEILGEGYKKYQIWTASYTDLCGNSVDSSITYYWYDNFDNSFSVNIEAQRENADKTQVSPLKICKGDKVSLSAITSGSLDEVVSYSWTINGEELGTNPNIDVYPTENTTYKVTAKIFDCVIASKEFSIEVDFLDAKIDDKFTVCYNGTANLNISEINTNSDDIKYEWRDIESDEIVSNSKSLSISNVTENKNISVTVTAGTCSLSLYTKVEVSEKSSPVLLSSAYFCLGTTELPSIPVSDKSELIGHHIKWVATTKPDLASLPVGTHNFKYITTNITSNCESNEGTWVVTVNDIPAVKILEQETLCPNVGEITIGSQITKETEGEYIYNWGGLHLNSTNGGEATFAIPNDYNKNYNINLSITDKNGCSSPIDEISLVVDDNVKPTITCPDDTTVNQSFGCSNTLSFNKGMAQMSDNCEIEGIYISFDTTNYTRIEGDINHEFFIGEHKVYWYAKDNLGNTSDTCEQTVTILDNRTFDINCPTIEGDNIAISSCTPQKWSDIMEYLRVNNLVATATLINCDGKNSSPVEPSKIIVSKSSEKNWFEPNNETNFDLKQEYTIRWIFKEQGLNIIERADSCELNFILDYTTKPKFNCPTNISKSIKNSCDTTIKFSSSMVSGLSANCGADIYISKEKLQNYNLIEDEISFSFKVGEHKVYWYAKDNLGNTSDTCEQTVTILDNRTFDINCPTIEGDYIISACDDASWDEISAKLNSEKLVATAAFLKCGSADSTKIEPNKIIVSEKGLNNWSEAEGTTFKFNTDYTIRWVFTKTGDYISAISDSCELNFALKDTTIPTFDCSTIDPDSIVHIVSGACDIEFKEITFKDYFADDCGKQIKGILSKTESLEDSIKQNDKFKVGILYDLKWIFQDESNNKVTCNQKLIINSDLTPIFNCNDLKPINKILDGTCSIDSANLITTTPIAKDACTDEEILGIGTRKSGKAMTEPFSVGADTIIWTFISKYSSEITTCEQPIFIKYKGTPAISCDTLNEIIDTTDECNIETTEIVSTPTATLPCGLGSVNGVGSRKSGLAMTDPFEVGNDTIVWKFFHEFLTDTITCEQPILIRQNGAPIFKCEDLKEIIDTTDNCSIDANEIVSVPKAAIPCELDSVSGVGYRKSGKAMEDPFAIGNDTIVWKFFHELLTDTVTCEQPVTILSSQAPIFECESLNDTTIALTFDECQLAPGKLNLVTPIAKDACTEEEIIGIPYRSDSLSINDSYPIGETTIEWIFISKYSTTSHSCYQKVTVIDTAAPMPNCDALDTIFVKISKDSEYTDAVTIQEAKAAGLTISVISDICEDSIIGVPNRNDGKAFEANYPIGNTSIAWIYTDKYGNKATCEQVVVVEDWIIDTLYCPGKLDGKTYSCIDEVPEPYKNIEEFFENGGSFSNLMKLNKNSFTSNDSIEGDSCEMILKRTYAVNDIRGNRIICQEFMSIKDDIAPTILTDLRDTMISCESEIFAALEIEVADNCDNAPKIEVKESNNRSENSLSCEYYNYDITRIYTITDRCNNVVRDTQLIQVRDTVGPKFDFPDNWGDSVLAESMKGCLFKMPDFTNQVKAFVKDNCSGNDSVKIVQVPTSESPITSSLWVTIYAYDMCGNVDSTFKYVEVKNSKTIANIIAYNIDTCINETKGIVLNKQDIRYASGYYEQYDKRTGLYYQIPSSFCYDYYRGRSVVEDSLIFSSNPKTYRNKFEELLAIYETYSDMEDAMTKLIKRSESGYYTFVAMDTLTGCTDTATSYINIKERPKVALKQSELIACENNLIDLDNYIACIDDMGGEISNSYWTKNDELFEYHDSVKGIVKYDDNNAKLLFYIENECGTTVSSKSRKLFCGESDSLSYEDTLRLLNNDLVALELLRMNELYTNDSIILDIHKRYSPNEIIIETNLGDPARIWVGEDIELSVKTDYDFNTLVWYEVKGKFDRDSFDSQNNLDEFVFDDLDDEEDMIVDITYGNGNNSISVTPNDTTLYYVTLSDNICPAIPSDLIQVNVLKQLPSAFTPHFLDGYNDTFMPNHQVMIFDRYGDKIFEGNDGWDGTFKGRRVDPAVYFYSVIMRNGTVIKGTIEVVKID